MKKILDKKKIKEIRDFFNSSEKEFMVDLWINSTINRDIYRGENLEYNFFDPFNSREMKGGNFTIIYNEEENTLLIFSSIVSKRLIYKLPCKFFLKITPPKIINVDSFQIEGSKNSNIHPIINFEIILENLNIKWFYINGSSEESENYLKPFLNKTIFSLKIVNIYHITHILRDFNHYKCVFEETHPFAYMSNFLRWKYILDNIAHLSVEGEVNFDENKKINYEILEMFYKYFSENTMLCSTDEVYVNLLKKI